VSSTGKELFAYYKDHVNMDDDEEAEDVDYRMVLCPDFVILIKIQVFGQKR